RTAMETPLRHHRPPRARRRRTIPQRLRARRPPRLRQRRHRELDAKPQHARGRRGAGRARPGWTGEHGGGYFCGPARQDSRHAGRGRAAGQQSPAHAGRPGDQTHRHTVWHLPQAAARRRTHAGGARRSRPVLAGKGEPMTTRLRRSELATPATRQKMIDKAARSDADLVFLDLEDAVAPAHKDSARRTAVAALRELDWGRKIRAVRVNGAETAWAYEDVITVVENAGAHLDVIILPKV